MSNELSTTKLVQIPNGIEKASEFIEFCKWAALPKTVREPHEQKELAKKLGVDETTLPIWKQHPEFGYNRSYYIKKWLGDDLPDVMHAVKKRAIANSTADAKLLLEWLDELRTSPDVQVNVQKNTINYSVEQVKEDWLMVGRLHPEWKEEL